ncbi:MAG: TolC family protein [Candidatus Symbiothrix sp.]|jgi:outer membrane protein|nr:TolC family protein [Candidatus Symbiothrix sp.]
MNKIVLGFIMMMTTVVAKTQNTTVVTLEDCLEYAYRQNYNLQSMELTEEAQEDAYRQSKMERLPSLSASASENLTHSAGSDASFGGSYGISANMTLYQGGAIDNAIEQNKLRKEQSAYQTAQYTNTLTVQILQAFLTALGNEELLKYQAAVINASEENARQGKAQYAAGSILESDYLLLEAQLANDRNNVVNTQISRDNSLLTLKSLMAMPASTNLQILPPDTSAIRAMELLPAADEVIKQTLNVLPDLKISQYNVDIAKVSLKMSKGNYLPTISLHGSIGTGHTEFDNFGTQLADRLNEQIGLSLSIPIYDNSRTKSKVTQSRIALQQAELDKKQAELDAEQTVVTEYQDVVSAYNKYKTNDIRQNAYSKTFDAYHAQFQAGSITAVNLLQQQNNYISALNDYIQSKYEFMLKRKILDVYMGVKITM